MSGHDEFDGIDEKRKRRSARLAVNKKLPPQMKFRR
jgi:hypothetical protein